MSTSSTTTLSSSPTMEIKQELLDTLDKLINHSQSEAQQLKDALQTLRAAALQGTGFRAPSPQQLPSSPQQPSSPFLVKEEVVDVEGTITSPTLSPPISFSSPSLSLSSRPTDEPLLGMSTLLKIKQELLKDLHKITRLPPPRENECPPPSSKRPRIELDLSSLSPLTSSSPPTPTTEPPMVLVPIPASVIEQLLKQNPGSPILDQLSSASSLQPPSKRRKSDEPATPLLSPTLTSSVLRFCERRAARDSVDVFHYLPADAKTSPFTTKPTNLSSKPPNYRKLLDDLTSTPAVAIAPGPRTYDILAKQQAKSMMNERTVYTTNQADRLEESFSKNSFLTKENRHQLSEELQIHPDRIKVWYQNRRARRRREEVLKERIELAARSRSSGC